ncbi:hypothetical protein [Tenacibaculum sp. 190524A02b]|uniref:hypothetical protein n=1 Tax=Tenacibaculum vairaonense TaxID=3137860 RepID=UPI0031FA8143
MNSTNHTNSKRLKLTKAQFKVTALIAMGEGAKGAANALFNSVRTIDTHLTRIKIQNNLRNTAELTKEFVLQYGDPSKYIEKIKNNEKIVLSITYFFLCTQIIIACIQNDIDLRTPRRVSRVRTKTVRKK